MRTVIYGGKIATPQQVLDKATLILEDGKIAAIEQGDRLPQDGETGIDAAGYWVTPGLIDIHMHGALGYDFMDASPEAVRTIAAHCARHGVTSYLGTTVSSSLESIQAAIDNLASNLVTENGARALGMHIEGPYLDVKYRGAQPERFLRDPDQEEYESWFESGIVRLVTVAPELSGAIEMIDRGRKKGVEFAVGHSAASYQQVITAADHGLRHATHTFNGMPGLHHRVPGPVGAVLSDGRIFAQLIADGAHLHSAVVRLAVATKGIHRSVLITDAVRAAGLPDGEFDLAGDKIIVQGGVSRTLASGLAGGTATLEACLRNAMQFAGLTFPEALTMATATPAASLGLDGIKGVLAPGADADVILLDQDLRVRKTILAGQLIFEG
ncbi:MAG: N-acetylglucosamine-6-phosphate deacetylase [Chloroflexi bacterium RBG_16_54_18]|nr:MAG: N-acetylglucosamine-6-phosphate deacetylase [Chloroflexi bacterium RBG_16_54_18]